MRTDPANSDVVRQVYSDNFLVLYDYFPKHWASILRKIWSGMLMHTLLICYLFKTTGAKKIFFTAQEEFSLSCF